MVTGAILRKGEDGYTYLKKLFHFMDDFQWIWGVLSGFEKNILKNDILQYELPYVNGYEGFWKEQISIQHPLASVELVAWDSKIP